jgi:two-component system NarL family sensor kinase
VGTDPTTDPRGPLRGTSPAGPAPAGDVPLLADELLGPAPVDPGVWETPADDDLDPADGDDSGWVTLASGGHRAPVDGALSTRRVLAQLGLAVLAALLVVGVLGSLAAKQLAEREAVNDAATMAGALAEAVVKPALTPGLMAGDPAAIAKFDDIARDHLLSTSIVRVKLWNAQGRVLYADEDQLVGRTYPLSPDQRDALEKPETVAKVSELDLSENAFEDAERAVEVYRPVWTPDGQVALFEIYASYDPVGERTGQLWRGFAGVTASSLVLFVLIVAPIVWHLLRRIRRAEEQRVELLQRAVDASTDERRRIAASLHDGPVQELAATSFTVAGASATAGTHGDRALARDLDAAAVAVRSSIRSLRTLLVDIYPASLTRSGVVAALLDLAQTTRREGLDVRVDAADEETLALGAEAQRLVHRVAQECLRNAAKHAGPASVTVSLQRESPVSVTLDVVDDGTGFDVDAVRAAPRDGHLGLRLLADAASVPGAMLQVSSAPGRGTHWRLVLDGPLGAVT